jgi:hypothetical protein
VSSVVFVGAIVMLFTSSAESCRYTSNRSWVYGFVDVRERTECISERRVRIAERSLSSAVTTDARWLGAASSSGIASFST